MKAEIYFNSKSKHYKELSNFYGGVEACYMSDRFRDVEVKRLFETFESLGNDGDGFIGYLQKLQPGKNGPIRNYIIGLPRLMEKTFRSLVY